MGTGGMGNYAFWGFWLVQLFQNFKLALHSQVIGVSRDIVSDSWL
jgi:hypothetical protein